MEKASGVLVADRKVQRPRPAPRLKLLIEWESRRRVFFGNLADLLLSRKVPPFPATAKPAPFWNDVFVPSGSPWSSFSEAMLLHLLLVVLFVWGQSKVWMVLENRIPLRDTSHRPIVYYPPPQSFPASGSRAQSHRPRPHPKRMLAKQTPPPRPIPVTPEHKPSLITPPDIRQAAARSPSLEGHTVTPMVPFSATRDSRQDPLRGPVGVVAPAPEVNQTMARRMAVPHAGPVAPAPELGANSNERSAKIPNAGSARVVPPPPAVQGTERSDRAGQLGSLSAAKPSVVPPPPNVQGSRIARLGSVPNGSSQVVPPPPALQGGGKSERSGRFGSMSGEKSAVVPPPPAVQGGGNARLGSIAGSGSQVVPPPPSVQGGSGPTATSRLGSLAGAKPSVVPPPPSVQGGGNGDARVSSMAGSGTQAVAPPPSVQANGSGEANRLGSLSGTEADAMPPPSNPGRAADAAGSGNGRMLEPMEPLPDGATPVTSVENANQAPAEELPLGLLGVVFAAPGTSFFSNFEVFVAKRRVGKDQLQLIKLVYEFLPYQRRLSQYNLNNMPARVIKLKVTPDPSCDESLGQIIGSHSDPSNPDAELPKLPAALRSQDMSAVLPCYRTTAGDFQKAMSR